MFETMPAPASTETKSGKFGPYNQTKREVKTRWVLNPEAEGVPAVVVDLFTSHYADRKQFSTTLTWGTVEKVERHPADGPGTVAIESWDSDHRMLRVHTHRVARYSVKAMQEHHTEALESVERNWHLFSVVFEEAAERSGLTVEEV